MVDAEPPQPDDGADIAAAEQWFTENGLPWFVDAHHDRVSRMLERGRLTRIALLAAVPALALGIGVGLLTGQFSNGLAAFAGFAALGVLAWAGSRLKAGTVARWALHRSLSQLRLLIHLVTRALPLLLIFMVFFFINTEVWHVASSLEPGVLSLTVMFFATLALVFLVAQLPAEVDRVVAQVDSDGDGTRLVAVCQGTPLAGRAQTLVVALTADQRTALEMPLTRLQRGNLILVLLLIEVGQVLMLAVSVFAFFVAFGAVAIGPEIIEAWIGREPRGSWVTNELLKVAFFLAGFSGLYFTVQAVSDPNYRKQFFEQLSTELERAVGVRAVYSVLRGSHNAGGDVTKPDGA